MAYGSAGRFSQIKGARVSSFLSVFDPCKSVAEKLLKNGLASAVNNC
jgi:hypothetical protein